MTTDTASRSEPRVADGPAIAAGRAVPLPVRYYLQHFTQVIDGVRARYGFLLNDHERRHLAVVEAITEPGAVSPTATSLCSP